MGREQGSPGALWRLLCAFLAAGLARCHLTSAIAKGSDGIEQCALLPDPVFSSSPLSPQCLPIVWFSIGLNLTHRLLLLYYYVNARSLLTSKTKKIIKNLHVGNANADKYNFKIVWKIIKKKIFMPYDKKPDWKFRFCLDFGFLLIFISVLLIKVSPLRVVGLITFLYSYLVLIGVVHAIDRPIQQIKV